VKGPGRDMPAHAEGSPRPPAQNAYGRALTRRRKDRRAQAVVVEPTVRLSTGCFTNAPSPPSGRRASAARVVHPSTSCRRQTTRRALPPPREALEVSHGHAASPWTPPPARAVRNCWRGRVCRRGVSDTGRSGTFLAQGRAASWPSRLFLTLRPRRRAVRGRTHGAGEHTQQAEVAAVLVVPASGAGRVNDRSGDELRLDEEPHAGVTCFDDQHPPGYPGLPLAEGRRGPLRGPDGHFRKCRTGLLRKAPDLCPTFDRDDQGIPQCLDRQ